MVLRYGGFAVLSFGDFKVFEDAGIQTMIYLMKNSSVFLHTCTSFLVNGKWGVQV